MLADYYIEKKLREELAIANLELGLRWLDERTYDSPFDDDNDIALDMSDLSIQSLMAFFGGMASSVVFNESQKLQLEVQCSIMSLELGLRWLNDRSDDSNSLKGLHDSIRKDIEGLMPILLAKGHAKAR